MLRAISAILPCSCLPRSKQADKNDHLQTVFHELTSKQPSPTRPPATGHHQEEEQDREQQDQEPVQEAVLLSPLTEDDPDLTITAIEASIEPSSDSDSDSDSKDEDEGDGQNDKASTNPNTDSKRASAPPNLELNIPCDPLPDFSLNSRSRLSYWGPPPDHPLPNPPIRLHHSRERTNQSPYYSAYFRGEETLPRILMSMRMEHVILHPLPLIAVSDYVVRHTLRKLDGPVVGALLGQQNGREVSIEFAYEAKTETVGDRVKLDLAWFDERLEQMRAVHKDRNLDLVGWFTQLPRDAPRDNVLLIHNQILEHHNESALLLGFHADEVGEESLGGKLPVTIYETNYEVEDPTKAAQDDGEDKEMKDGDGQVKLSFRQVPFIVETGEAEMISMSDVASGATNAASAHVRDKQKDSDSKGKGKGKGKKVAKDTEKIDPNTVPLSQEDEDMIAAIQTKANAIKMLKSRIDLIIKYLQKLPPPYIAEVEAEASGDSEGHTEPSQPLLRLIQALVHRLSLVEPADAEEFKKELMREENDVQVINMLNELMTRVNATRDVGKKFSAIESGKAAQKQYTGFSGSGSQQYSSLSYGSGAGDLMM